ncbi:MAG: RNA polymerase sigma factor [Chthoniobacteraceae bacterium]
MELRGRVTALSYKVGAGALIPKCMTARPELIDQLAALHDDAFGWAVACCSGDADAAADALQDSYVKVATGRAAFGGRSSLKTWWLGVVRFTALERRRGQHRWMRAVEVFREWMEHSRDDSPEPEELSATPDANQLAAALAQLPARQAEVLHLAFAQGLSLSEAAAVMGVSVGSARQHYDRAKKRLRILLAAAAPAAVFDHAP